MKPKRRGRPPVDNPSSEQVHIRVTPEKKATWEAAASRAGATLSAWIARILDRAAKR